MDRNQQKRFLEDLYEEMEISQERLAQLLRISPKIIHQWENGEKILEYGQIKALEAILEGFRLNKLEELDLQSRMEHFCKTARISEHHLAQLLGLSSVNQLFEVYRKKSLPHVRHFALLQREQIQSGRTGHNFLKHMEMVHYAFIKKK